MKSRKFLTTLLLLSILVLACISNAYAAIRPSQSQHADFSKSLDEDNLKSNALHRLRKTIQQQNPSAKGLELLSQENIQVKGKVPVQIGSLNLWLVNIEISNLPTPEKEDSSSVAMAMTVDPTGTYQYGEITEIATARNLLSAGRRILNKTEVPKNLGTKLLVGEGKSDVLFISDPFCSFCRRQYQYLNTVRKKIGTLRILHMPMKQLHPTATIASAVLAYGKEKMHPEQFKHLVDFAYSELEENVNRKDQSNFDLRQAELSILNQFLTKFPSLKGNQDQESLYYFIKGKYAAMVEEEANQAMRLFNARGTPLTIIDGAPIRGFNQIEINDALGI